MSDAMRCNGDVGLLYPGGLDEQGRMMLGCSVCQQVLRWGYDCPNKDVVFDDDIDDLGVPMFDAQMGFTGALE